MITLNDVDTIVVGSSCQERWPCGHSSTVTLKDGRSTSCRSSFDICSIVSNIAKEKINPGKKWGADRVREHFREYNRSVPNMGWVVETPEIVLNRIFSKK